VNLFHAVHPLHRDIVFLILVFVFCTENKAIFENHNVSTHLVHTSAKRYESNNPACIPIVCGVTVKASPLL
jgi:hypothetical protein